MSDISLGGKWNILGEKYEGELIFNKENGVILLSVYYNENRGFAGLFHKPAKIKEITGITNQNHKCILIDCTIIKRHSQNFIRNHIVIKANALFFNVKKRKKETLKFDEIEFKLSNILRWTNLNGFEYIYNNNDYSSNIGYKFKKEIILNLDDSTTATFIPILGPQKFDIKTEKIELSQSVKISIKKNKTTIYDNFFKDIEKIINLITLAINKKIEITQIKCKNYNDFYMIGDRKEYIEYEMIDYRMKNESYQEDSVLDESYYLFDLNEILNHDKIKNWFEKYEEYKNIYDLFLLAKKNTVTNEIRFCNLMQAIELIHSNQFKKKRKFMNHIKEKFKSNTDIIQNIEENIDQKDCPYIILRSRLIDLFINQFELSNNFFIRNNVCTFCDILTDSRNYYTHYSNSKKGKCVIKENLYNSIYILEYLTSCYILDLLGFSLEYINQKMNERIRIINDNNMINKIIENKR